MIEYKGYQIKSHKEYPSLLIVVTEGQGGKIPNILSGIFTNSGLAMREIDNYLSTKKVEKDAKTVQQS